MGVELSPCGRVGNQGVGGYLVQSRPRVIAPLTDASSSDLGGTDRKLHLRPKL